MKRSKKAKRTTRKPARKITKRRTLGAKLKRAITVKQSADPVIALMPPGSDFEKQIATIMSNHKEAAKRLGRPSPDGTPSKVISVRATEAMVKRWHKRAEAVNADNFNAWILEVLNGAAGGE